MPPVSITNFLSFWAVVIVIVAIMIANGVSA